MVPPALLSIGHLFPADSETLQYLGKYAQQYLQKAEWFMSTVVWAPYSWCWAIERQDTQKVAGFAGLTFSGTPHPGYYIYLLDREGSWGRGIGTAVTAAIGKIAFQGFKDIPALVTYIMSDNVASQKMVSKNGWMPTPATLTSNDNGMRGARRYILPNPHDQRVVLTGELSQEAHAISTVRQAVVQYGCTITLPPDGWNLQFIDACRHD